MARNTIPYQSSKRRSGQALILAVLIMVFIVLLGTTFIAIVSTNMSNTARTASKDQARLAAQAGINFADAQLTGSPSGLDWRPEAISAPPVVGDATYSFYWTALDRAQGWSGPSSFYVTKAGSTTPAEYVKFPNPLQKTSTDNASHFMIRVSQVEAGDPDNNSASAYSSKTGDIRIESIGFANDDPAAFYRVVAYKKGPGSNPLTVAMRSVSNWDFDGNAVPQGTTTAASSSANLELTDLQGSFSKDDYVTVFDPTSNQVGYAQVAIVSTTGANTTLNVTPALSFTPSAGAVVQRAAQLGIPDAFAIKYDNQTDTSVDFRVSGLKNKAGTDINTPGSVWVNGGLVWYGKTYSTNLVSSAAATASNPASNILVSGVFTSNNAATPVQVTGSGVATDTAIPTSSADPAFATNATVTNGLVNDGFNRLRGSLDPSRQVQQFTPADITSGGDGFGRYRQLTQYSASTDSTNPQASAYGYGQGIYINNPTDIEKVNGVAMTTKQLHDLWLDVGTQDFNRMGTPDAADNLTSSLEQQHLRGWVSPDQFLPRGAEVVLNANNTITITLDSRADNNSTATCGTAPYPDCSDLSQGSVPSKSWRGVDGNLLGDATVGGVYTQTFSWPADGTLFAEGNIRIRGVNPAATSSLTVVSMNNIYIDGSLQLGNSHKVLLLAKNNVIANPTQALQTIDPQTRLMVAIPSDGSTQTSITVYDAAGFRKGDLIEVENGGGNDRQLRVNGDPTGSPATGYTVPVMAFSTTSAAYTVGTRVHLSTDPGLDVTGTYAGRPYTAAIRLSRFTHAIQRRVDLTAGTTDLRLAFRHSAEYRAALTVGTKKELAGPPTNPPTLISATLANKLVATSPESIIQAADKTMTVDYTQNPPNTPSTDTFLQTAPTDQATAAATTLVDLKTEMEALRSTPNWHYDVTVEHDYGTATKLAPFYFLSGVGNRYNFGVAAPGPGLPVRQDIFDPKTYTIPLATSVWLTMNGTPVQMQDNHWNASLNSGAGGFGIVNQFGFNPIYINSDGTNPLSGDAWYDHEDVLTSDQYFYQPNTGTVANDEQPSSNTYTNQTGYDNGTNTKYTLDSRELQGFTAVAGGNDVAIQLDDAEVDPVNNHNLDYYFYAPNSSTADARIPFYRLSNLKIENETLDTTSSHDLVSFGSVDTMDINAYVYAQEGSWYVIAPPKFDTDVKNGDDLNRDGVISAGESVAAYRYNHYNYQITFTGSIMENRTPTPDDVSTWMDKNATVQMTIPTAAPTYDSKDPQNSNFGDILYFYDPAAAIGISPTEVGFNLPVATGGLIYQG